MIDIDPNSIPYNTPHHLNNLTLTQLKLFLLNNNFKHSHHLTHYNPITNTFITIYPHPTPNTFTLKSH